MRFTHLHAHSHYSLLDGLPKIGEFVQRAKELDMDSLALTDHGVLYGAVEFYGKAKAAGIKPIIGCEIYVAPNGLENKRPKIDYARYHLILLTKNLEGYRNLIKLVTIAHLKGFYYKPRIDKETLAKHSAGLIGLSACLAGEIPRKIIAGDSKGAEKAAREYADIFGAGNFFLEIQHHPNIPEQEKANQEIIKIARRLNFPVTATQDLHYLHRDDRDAHDVLLAVQTGKDVEDEERLTMKHEDFSMTSPEEMTKFFSDFPEAVENTQVIAASCNVELELGNPQLPNFQVPAGYSAESYLKELAYRGLEKRYNISPAIIQQLIKNGGQTKENAPFKDYLPIIARLEYELGVIASTGFASYFLIVGDFVNWAKTRGIIVGPGRGSAAGSLVSYLLNITNIDPLKYDLLFERFLNAERISMPDIDIDFADTRRDEVIAYVAEKYGRDKVAQIITFGTMAARAAIRDTGRALNYSYGYCDVLAKLIPPKLNLKQAAEQVDELKAKIAEDPQAARLFGYASKLEGVARHASTHACGVVIGKDSLDKIVPLQYAPQSENVIVTQYEMNAVDSLGLLKMDFLGLKNLTIIENTLKLVEKIHGKKIDIDDIPMNDKKAFEVFQEAKTTGVFQLESGGMKRYLKQLRPTELEDIIAMVSLFRPGPMELIPDYIDRKHGRKKVEYLHPKLEPILKKTYGIMIYQEQLMQAARDLAGLSMSEADTLRKAVGKKIKKLLNEQKEKLVGGMVKRGIDKKIADKFWGLVEPFADYGFNRSHAACYALIAYQTAYLKGNWPVEFMASLATSEKNDVERVAFLVGEMREMGIEVAPPSINESFADFSVVVSSLDSGKPQIRFGLAAVKNVGENFVGKIIAERKKNGPFKSISDFLGRLEPEDLNKKSLESLIKCGALDDLGERNSLLTNLENILKNARDHHKEKNSGLMSLFGSIQETAPRVNLQPSAPALPAEKLGWEKELLGLYISNNPLTPYKEIIGRKATAIKEVISGQKDQSVIIGGIIGKTKKITTKTGQSMIFAELEDFTAKIELIIFPSVLEKTRDLWQDGSVVLIKGKLNDRDGEMKIIVDQAKKLSEEPGNNQEISSSSDKNDPSKKESSNYNYIFLSLKSAGDLSLLKTIREKLEKIPVGQTKIYLRLPGGNGAQKIETPYSIITTPEIISALKDIIGNENLEMR